MNLLLLFIAVGVTFSERCAELVANKGAVAVMDLRNGRLIVATDSDILFAHRYPPGSVAKILTSMAAAKAGVDFSQNFVCKGFEIGTGDRFLKGDTLKCSLRGGHGKVDFHRALLASCNLYFQNLAYKLKPQELADIYFSLGLNNKVGVNLPSELASIVQIPANDSAKLAFAIGQGSALQLTPVAMLAMISGVAKGGEFLRPHLEPGGQQILASFSEKSCLADIRLFLRDAVRSGTGKNADIAEVNVAGKTGSSTVLGSWRTYGWFAGFAPFEEPQIAVVVFLERGEGKDAAKIAGMVISDYFHRRHGD